MAASPCPSASISGSLLCSASSSSSFRHALLSLVSGDFCGGPRQRVLNSKSSSCAGRRRREGSVRRAALNTSTSIDPQPSFANPEPDIASLKLKLLVRAREQESEVDQDCQGAVSGLNRGLAASVEDLRLADSAAKELAAAGRPVFLSEDLDKLQGKWRLIYSSAFSSRSLGGSRPGPPTGRLIPITLGQVFQRIDILSKDFDNIVELQFGTPWPFPQIEATATLAHKFELIGTANIKITFEKTTVKPSGNLSQFPPLELPRLPDALRPPSNTGSGEFEVIYLDSDLRITRGDRGELRVFVIT
ncbi:plastid-lipid-associated protein 6, chloroplastic isoform X1 [Dendrobium catenatum]|uniref:plastid-lipid-associated protein 6, chloroplastic isoform X1 n=1 Tax=Dendrobium catenatum TaxID=906689 RepID=UPI0009F287C2|nr:plastid-lipid-associated protein 6, chloroplastic isoform X1 [Dendrobium catenatum]